MSYCSVASQVLISLQVINTCELKCIAEKLSQKSNSLYKAPVLLFIISQESFTSIKTNQQTKNKKT